MLRAGLLVVVSGMLLAFPRTSVGQQSADEVTIQQEIDSFFVRMRRDFEQIAASPLLRKKAVAPVNAYFLRLLRANRTYYSLTRTDDKGMAINEVIRLVQEPSKKYDASGESWYKKVSASLNEFTTCVKWEEAGRYQLLWALPIMGGPKDAEKFQGVLMMKIDLWDCFHGVSKSPASPFLVRFGRLWLYSHNWSDSIRYVEKPLAVPGVQKISLRYPDPSAVSEADTAVAASSPAGVDSADYAAALRTASRRGAVVAWLVVIIVLLTATLASYVVKPLAEVRERLMGRPGGGAIT